MAKCDYCGSTILLGGVRDQGLRFCNAKCHQNGILLSVAQQVPTDILQKQVDTVHQGTCPQCQGPGPVDVHTSYRVWSAVYLTSWSSRPHVSCRSCGVKKQLGDFAISLFFGWWGFPWGFIFTPVQLTRNIIGMVRPPAPADPSPMLSRVVCLNIASHLAQQSRVAQAASPAA